MFSPNREELAWAAGFFDGEGCISLEKNLYRDKIRFVMSPRIAIAQAGGTNGRELLERFQHAVGGVGKVNGPYRHKGKPNHSQFHVFNVWKFEHIQAVIAMLWPFLGRNKKDQAKLVLQGA